MASRTLSREIYPFNISKKALVQIVSCLLTKIKGLQNQKIVDRLMTYTIQNELHKTQKE